MKLIGIMRYAVKVIDDFGMPLVKPHDAPSLFAAICEKDLEPTLEKAVITLAYQSSKQTPLASLEKSLLVLDWRVSILNHLTLRLRSIQAQSQTILQRSDACFADGRAQYLRQMKILKSRQFPSDCCNMLWTK